MHYMEIGGGESALIGLLQALDPQRVDIDLFLYDHRGEMMQYIPEYVNMLPLINEYSLIERPISEVVKKGFLKLAIARIRAKIKSANVYKQSQSKMENASVFHYVGEFTHRILPKISSDREYDLAISFMTPHQYVVKNVNAKKKIGWIHTDYTKIFVDAKNEERTWNSLDYIVSISPDVTKSFVSVFPNTKSKIVEIENIISPEFIRSRAEDAQQNSEIKKSDNTINLLTIGRLAPQKKLEDIPEICAKIIESGINVKWYIIGYGSIEAEQQLQEQISKFGMENHVIFLGKRENPYPYIKACDVYVQPSRYEGKSITVREAQILYKPVIVTNYPTASSQIKDNIDGKIVPMEINECSAEITKFIKNLELQHQIISYLKIHDFGNISEIEKIYQLTE